MTKELKSGMLFYQDGPDQPKRIFGFTSETLKITPVEEDKTSPDPEWINTSPTWEVKGEITINKKDAEKLRRTLFQMTRKSRIPRKLKKAYKHLQLIKLKHENISDDPKRAKMACNFLLTTMDGYKHTKWVRKAISHFAKVMEQTNKMMDTTINRA